MIRAFNLKRLRFMGIGDMAQSFAHPDGGPFALSFLRVHFSGSSGGATLTLSVDSDAGTPWDTTVYTLANSGPSTAGSDVNLRIGRDELEHWAFEADDTLLLSWTDPDAGDTTQWGIEIGLVQVEYT